MRCARCGSRLDLADNYCRRCGIALNRVDLPTVVSRTFLPVPWQVAPGTIVRGMMALVVGTVVEMARREVARRITTQDPSRVLGLLASGKPVESRRGLFPWSRAPKGEYEVTETVIQRSTRFFRK